jgi:EAL domain-containing protein (putative c-di-GMP-specific phosphodiesterase class I)
VQPIPCRVRVGDDKFLPFVIDQFHRSGWMLRKICFEITETAAVASFSQANRFIQALKELGCKFALDEYAYGEALDDASRHRPQAQCIEVGGARRWSERAERFGRSVWSVGRTAG